MWNGEQTHSQYNSNHAQCRDNSHGNENHQHVFYRLNRQSLRLSKDGIEGHTDNCLIEKHKQKGGDEAQLAEQKQVGNANSKDTSEQE